MVEGGQANRNPLTAEPAFGYLSGLWLKNTWWSEAPASTTSRTSRLRSREIGSPSSPDFPARESHPLPSIRSTPRDSDATWSRCRRTRASFSAHGKARRRRHRRPLSRHLDRAEDHRSESALDGRDRHRDLRLSSAALGAGRSAALSQRRHARHTPERVADYRHRAHVARGDPDRSARADRSGTQG